MESISALDTINRVFGHGLSHAMIPSASGNYVPHESPAIGLHSHVLPQIGALEILPQSETILEKLGMLLQPLIDGLRPSTNIATTDSRLPALSLSDLDSSLALLGSTHSFASPRATEPSIANIVNLARDTIFESLIGRTSDKQPALGFDPSALRPLSVEDLMSLSPSAFMPADPSFTRVVRDAPLTLSNFSPGQTRGVRLPQSEVRPVPYDEKRQKQPNQDQPEPKERSLGKAVAQAVREGLSKFLQFCGVPTRNL